MQAAACNVEQRSEDVRLRPFEIVPNLFLCASTFFRQVRQSEKDRTVRQIRPGDELRFRLG
jgi:hypothetical protein